MSSETTTKWKRRFHKQRNFSIIIFDYSEFRIITSIIRTIQNKTKDRKEKQLINKSNQLICSSLSISKKDLSIPFVYLIQYHSAFHLTYLFSKSSSFPADIYWYCASILTEFLSAFLLSFLFLAFSSTKIHIKLSM